MAEALARGLARAGLLVPGRTFVHDPAATRSTLFAREFGAEVKENNAAAATAAEVLFLCVKPQTGEDVLRELAPVFAVERHLLVSILAGTATTELEQALPEGARVVRVMPNLPMLVGAGAAAVCGGRAARTTDVEAVEAFLGTAATVVRVEEKLMNAVTALSGSGPAYLCCLAEALEAAGRAEGLSAEQARKLTVRTLFGTARMLEETRAEPAELRRRVTSPGGTTAAAVEVLEKHKVREAWSAAVHRAVERGRELGKKQPERGRR